MDWTTLHKIVSSTADTGSQDIDAAITSRVLSVLGTTLSLMPAASASQAVSMLLTHGAVNAGENTGLRDELIAAIAEVGVVVPDLPALPAAPTQPVEKAKRVAKSKPAKEKAKKPAKSKKEKSGKSRKK